VPKISEFYGIAICMYFDDHSPPHFHAIYGEHEAIVTIATSATVRGSLPPRAAGLVKEWTAIHRSELLANWQRARIQVPLEEIAPLD
jgi:hypothetical protein